MGLARLDYKNVCLIEKFRGELMKRGRDAGNTAFSCLVSRLAACDPEMKRIPLLDRPQTSPRHHYLVGGEKRKSSVLIFLPPSLSDKAG